MLVVIILFTIIYTGTVVAAVIAKYLIGRGWKNVETNQIERNFYDKFSNQRNRMVKKAKKATSPGKAAKRKASPSDRVQAAKKKKPNARARAQKRTAAAISGASDSSAGEESSAVEFEDAAHPANVEESSSDESSDEETQSASQPSRKVSNLRDIILISESYIIGH